MGLVADTSGSPQQPKRRHFFDRLTPVDLHWRGGLDGLFSAKTTCLSKICPSPDHLSWCPGLRPNLDPIQGAGHPMHSDKYTPGALRFDT